jgi:hypothetical protein
MFPYFRQELSYKGRRIQELTHRNTPAVLQINNGISSLKAGEG